MCAYDYRRNNKYVHIYALRIELGVLTSSSMRRARNLQVLQDYHVHFEL